VPPDEEACGSLRVVYPPPYCNRSAQSGSPPVMVEAVYQNRRKDFVPRAGTTWDLVEPGIVHCPQPLFKGHKEIPGEHNPGENGKALC